MISPPDRLDPPIVADETTMLDAWLDYERNTLALKCAGLTDDQLRERAVPPSSLSLLGLLRHMTEVERGWFSRTLAGTGSEPLYYSDDRPDEDFDDLATPDPAEAYANWVTECDTSREHATRFALDDVGRGKRRRPGDKQVSLRWIMVHMIEEYARRNGHADFLRERIDGSTGM
jgi:uncharacterized damage-inducible protein DinB